MNYIRKIEKNSEIDGKIVNITITKYLENLARENLKTIDSIIFATKKKLNIKRNVPIYINDDIILASLSSLRSQDSFFFNILELDDMLINDECTTFLFKDGSKLNLIASKYRVSNAFKKANLVVNHIELLK